MEYLGMKSLDVIPNASEERKDILESICAGIVDRHIPFQFNGSITPKLILIKCTSIVGNY